MPELILGLHAGINATAAIGDAAGIRHCVQEERLTGEKGYMGFPARAIAACLNEAGAGPDDIAVVACGSRFGYAGYCSRDDLTRRLRSFHRPAGLPGRILDEWRAARQRQASMRDQLAPHLRRAGLGAVPLTCYDHHAAHGAAAYYGLRADPATPYLVLTCDGFGDGACATVAVWQDGQRRELARTGMQNSAGLLYFWTTQAAGFRPHEDEYKLMGMAPYASAHRAAQIASTYRRYLGLDDTGLRFRRQTRLSVELSWPRLAAELRGLRFDDLFGGLQLFTEDLLTRWAESAVRASGVSRVLAGGGVFMNVKASQRIAASPSVGQFEAFPSCGDESLALGAYYLAAAGRYGQATVPRLAHCYLGDDITPADARTALTGTPFAVEEPADLPAAVAGLLAGGQVVARCAGRMEFGARALGNRSILADPGNAGLPRLLNQAIKRRDFWMPFAPAMLASRQHRYIRNPRGLSSPYMMMAFDADPDTAGQFIAAVHGGDLTCRAQLVPDSPGCGLRDILRAWEARTGKAVLLNTSLNLHGEPIARTASDALRVFSESGLQHLQLGPYLVHKKAG
ncbi:MAG TPA: carbamoyltransferase C-terminal domain-containing protein [Streptosporangiaceae bacterium]|nr:carbamoyltransferase C-terminal domain-containing protein [Streptosporangiaceae bacterium]